MARPAGEAHARGSQLALSGAAAWWARLAETPRATLQLSRLTITDREQRGNRCFYTHAIVAACRRMDVRFSITIRQSASLRSLIEAIPEQDWTPIPYWMEGAAAVAETSYTPFQSKPDAAPVRLIVRRVKPTPGSQLALFATYAITASSPTGRGKPWHWRPTIGATPRSRTPSETSSTAWG